MTESFLSRLDLLTRSALVPLLESLDRLGVDRRDLLNCETYLSSLLSSTIPARPRSLVNVCSTAATRGAERRGGDGEVVEVHRGSVETTM